MWFLYQIAIALALILIGPFLLLRRGTHYLATIRGRLGRFQGQVPDRPLWIHAVSVGEVGVAAALTRHLPADLPLLVTTITPTGHERAQSVLGERAAVTYLPFELGFAIDKFLKRFEPRGLILVEGDYWPLLLSRVAQHRLPVAVVNGRVSDHSFKRMMRLQVWLGPLFEPVTHFGMQSREDGERLAQLGVEPARIVVTGNLKFESPAPPQKPELETAVGRLANGRPIIVAGSTMAGEEELVLDAFRQNSGGRRAMLILAPRHPERWDAVARIIRDHDLTLLRRSELTTSDSDPDVLLLDTLGELAAIYGCGIGSFIGGTLVPTGGHNPLEAAYHAVAIAAGPAMENFREIAAAFDRNQAWRRVANSTELARTWQEWIEDPVTARELGRKGEQVLISNRGAMQKTLDFLNPIMAATART